MPSIIYLGRNLAVALELLINLRYKEMAAEDTLPHLRRAAWRTLCFTLELSEIDPFSAQKTKDCECECLKVV